MNDSRFLTPRQQSREAAFQFLFRIDQENISSSEIESEFNKHCDHFSIHEAIRAFAFRLILQTVNQKDSIDQLIEKHLLHWKMERLSQMDRSLLRLGVGELMFCKDIPANVTLDEVIEMGKLFGTEDSSSFLNGVLDPISKLPEALAGKVPSTT